MILDIIKKHIESGKIYKIVFFGDSITSTEWVHPNWREIVEYVVKEEVKKLIDDWKLPSWNIRCINSGLDGSTSADWLDKVDEYVLSYKPNLAISIFGGNDTLFNISSKDHGDNLQKLFELMSGGADKYYFCTTTPYLNSNKNIEYQPFLEAEKDLILKENVKFVELFNLYLDFPLKRIFTFIEEEGNPEAGIKPGGLDWGHPNQLGNAYIAKVQLKEIFGIEFDPEQYMKDTLAGKKSPGY